MRYPKIRIRCTVQDGMFSDEAVIGVKLEGGEVRHYTVPKVETDVKTGTAIVELMTANVILIPTEYKSMIKIDEKTLVWDEE